MHIEHNDDTGLSKHEIQLVEHMQLVPLGNWLDVHRTDANVTVVVVVSVLLGITLEVVLERTSLVVDICTLISSTHSPDTHTPLIPSSVQVVLSCKFPL